MKPNHPMHLIGNAHLDPIWLWRWQEGFAEIKATFQSALNRMEETPGFIFTCACAAYYRYVHENDPVMFERIRSRVREGRWVIVGGWWIQPDCNIPGGESFVRHALYSQRYFMKEFGKIATVGYNVDSFGHNAMLPQILLKSGMPNYVFMRPDPKDNPNIPRDLFWWESMDGSQVLAYKLPLGYAIWEYEDSDPPYTLQRMDDIARIINKTDLPQMAFYGVGNRGGGPTIEQLALIRERQSIYGNDLIHFSSPNTFFENIRARSPSLPTWKDDLQHNASGCYSTMAAVKAANRKAESRLLTAEKMAALADTLLGTKVYPHSFAKAWEKVMFNHFHDIMGGCSIRAAYHDVMEFYGQSLTMSGEILNDAIQRMSWALDTSRHQPPNPSKKNVVLWDDGNRGAPIVVFNPHSWEVTAPIQIDRVVMSVTDDSDNPQEIQKVRAGKINVTDKWDSLFMAIVPPLGYRLYWAYLEKSAIVHSSSQTLSVDEYTMENNWIRVELDPHTGYIAKLIEKQTGASLLCSPGAVPVVVDIEHTDTWGHDTYRFDQDIGAFDNAQVVLKESGPVRARFRVVSKYKQSVLKQDFMLYRDKPGLFVKAFLSFYEPHRMVKLSFPVAVENPCATYEIPYGHIIRPTNGEEEPGQQWLDITGIQDKKILGLSLLNESKYSFSVQDNDMRMTLVNTSIYADHLGYAERDDECEFMDLGSQDFEYALVPHVGRWQDACITQAALELNSPLIHVQETYHTGPLNGQSTGIQIDVPNIICTAFKRAEDGNGFVLRFHETSGQDVQACISLPMLARSFAVSFTPCEIKTFLISNNKERSIIETNLLEFDQPSI